MIDMCPQALNLPAATLATCLLFLQIGPARADIVTDWNERAEAIAAEKRAPVLSTTHDMAMLHVAMFDAVNSIDRRHTPFTPDLDGEPTWSKEAAAATAAYTILVKIFPDQRPTLEAALSRDLAGVADGVPKARGVELGRKAANAVSASRVGDGMNAREAYRPSTQAGVYVPTTLPVSPTHGSVRPWVLTTGSQVRPAAPPPFDSRTWTEDLNEVRDIAGRDSVIRTSEQTDIARFWFLNGPATWNPIVRQVVAARQPDLATSARIFAQVAIAAEDAYIAVYDAKYHYNFWRPITAIRNADLTGNESTPRDASWMPFGQGLLALGDTPMHPEYPCAHCITSSAVGTILQSHFGDTVPEITVRSPTAPGVTRRWTSLRAYMEEVALARIYAGFHYRFSTRVGMDMGRRIAEATLASRMRDVTAIGQPLAPTR